MCFRCKLLPYGQWQVATWVSAVATRCSSYNKIWQKVLYEALTNTEPLLKVGLASVSRALICNRSSWSQKYISGAGFYLRLLILHPKMASISASSLSTATSAITFPKPSWSSEQLHCREAKATAGLAGTKASIICVRRGRGLDAKAKA